jgi:hypothetical protein
MSNAAEPSFVKINTVPGLIEYYASQAELMLSQYENINHLLGNTHYWQHPGELCEVLLRDFLRRMLPKTYSVDKGFIYGRTTIDKIIQHSPEIDILIHDTQHYSPLFRMDNFVIIQPGAVRALIQVKRTLNAKELDSGIENVVYGKLHWVNLMLQANKSVFKQPYHVFSAVIGFDEDETTPKSGEPYRRRLRHWHELVATRYDRPGEAISLLALPEFIGSLKGRFVLNAYPDIFGTAEDREYTMGSSQDGKNNVALQAMLYVLCLFVIRSEHWTSFSFPAGMEALDRFRVLDPPRSTSEPQA